MQQAIPSIKKAQNKQNYEATGYKQGKIHKDYVYRFGKIEQNCILKQKNQKQFSYADNIDQNNLSDDKFAKKYEIVDEDEDQQIYLDTDISKFGCKILNNQELNITNNQELAITKNQELNITNNQGEQKQVQEINLKRQNQDNKKHMIYCIEDSQQEEQLIEQPQNINKKQVPQSLSKDNQDQAIKKQKIWTFQQSQDEQQIQENEHDNHKSNSQDINPTSNHSIVRGLSLEYQNKDNDQINQNSSQQSKQQIKGIQLTSNPLEGNVNITILDKRQFVMSEVPPGIIIKCVLRRSSGFLNPYTQFDLFLHNGLKHFLSAKRFPLAKTQVFKLSTSTDLYSQQFHVGSLMTNTVHSNYWLLADSLSKKNYKDKKYLNCYISYDKKITKNTKRGLQALFPQNCQQKLISYDNSDLSPSIIKDMMHLKLINKQSQTLIQNQDDISQVQKMQSTKNMILVDEDDDEYEYLKFEKISKDLFHLKMQHPLTPLQAFSFVLTRFDAQLQ